MILRVDGGLKSGVDVMMAAAMGADEFGFGSVAMIATGCVMARICHTNNCPVGVASQVSTNFVALYHSLLPLPPFLPLICYPSLSSIPSFPSH